MDYQVLGNKIANDYVHKNIDMNESIVKYAEQKSLNLEQIKRLVEESNKECFLQKFAETGEQIFDVASLDKIKNLVKSPVDSSLQKTASIKSEIKYNNYNVYGYDVEIEKNASIAGSVVNGVVGTGANIGSHAAGFVAKAPFKRGLNPLMQGLQAKNNMKKFAPSKEETAFISNSPTGVQMEKEAGFGTEVVNGFKNFVSKDIPAHLPILAVGLGAGLGVAAARKMGGLSARMMNQRELDESFNTIIKNNNDLANVQNVRGYFDVIARHSPDLAKDPLVAPQLIRQFDSFGGVDLNTVAKMREMQYKFGPDNRQQSDVYDTIGGMTGGVKSIFGGKR